MTDIPLSLYIHWPWCVRKCPYCDFNSHGFKGDLPEDRYVHAICTSLDEQKPWANGRKINTIFFGGGTPSLMTAFSIERILSHVQRVFGLENEAEITLESNPGTLESDKLKDFRAAGINRISLGIQSFDDDKLKSLGRIHNGNQAREAALKASELFDNFNLDLMFGLPGQTTEDLRKELDVIRSFNPPHLSYYQLTLEPNTYFAKFPPPNLPDSDELADMTEVVSEETGNMGYDHYEISAYAKPGHYCRHNLNYWSFGDYLAVGPGAHGKYTYTEGEQVYRFYNYRDPARWLRSFTESESPVALKKIVSADELPFEFMLNALRLKNGVPRSYWEERTGISWMRINDIWERLQKSGLVRDCSQNICTGPNGWIYLNDVLEAFL